MIDQIEFSDAARAETDAAYLYLLRRAPEAAAQWLEGLDAVLASLAASLSVLPGRRAYAPENDLFPDIEIFQLIYGKRSNAYRVLYYLVDADDDGEADTLRVLHIRHGAQQRLGQITADEE
jgi:plasmid stabilization system protein ParE